MFNIMNLIPNSENMEPPPPPNYDEKIASFGKNIGKTFSHVYEKDKGYVKWVLGCKECSGAMLLLKNYFTIREESKSSKKKSVSSP
jgi:hypothetical protein